MTIFDIPPQVSSIEEWAFASCESLSSMVIPDSVTNLEKGVFCGCTSLSSVSIGNGVSSIEPGTFGVCSALTTLRIGSGVKTISKDVFLECSSLQSITYNGTKEQWQQIALAPEWNEDIPAKVVHCSDGDVELGTANKTNNIN